MTEVATKPTAVTDDTFTAMVEQSRGLVLVDFWATWCGPCQMIAPILDQLAGQYAGRVRIYKLDTDANQKTAFKFNIRSIPAVLFFKDGKHVDTVIGAVPRQALEARIEQHLR